MTEVKDKTGKIRVLLAGEQAIVRRGLALLLREQEGIDAGGRLATAGKSSRESSGCVQT